MNSLDIDQAIDYVNKLVDNVRCDTCDKLEGCRLRYRCGHTGCEDCVVYTECCPVCTPPKSDSEVRTDHPWTETAKHAITLLEACHKLFGPEAFQRKRISEQLKIEKDLFPQCIQAPMKYENKRRSTRFSLNNKENSYTTLLPGETISSTKNHTMENSMTYVHQWLNKNEKNLGRKPFADLNANIQRSNNTKNKNITQNIEKSKAILKNRKRSHFKTTSKNSSFIADNKKSKHDSSLTLMKAKNELPYINNVQHLFDNDESGIFMDNETIIIDESGEPPIDKDRQACLAVLEAHKKEQIESTSLPNNNQDKNKNIDNQKQIISSTYDIKDNNLRKVPFYKYSSILETCHLCKDELNYVEDVNVTSQSEATTSQAETMTSQAKPVVITVDSDTFSTTITVIKNVQDKKNKSVNSVSVQTDTNFLKYFSNDKDVEANFNETEKCHNNFLKNIPATESDTQSEDLFADDRKIFEEIVEKRDLSGGVVIEETDSDSDLEMSGPVSIQAEVHRSCEELEPGVLTDIVNVKEHESKCRRAPRGTTPTSTDSSEKENFDPNRMRRHSPGKKKPLKK